MQKILKNMQGMNAIAKHVHLMHLYIENNGKVTQWTAKIHKTLVFVSLSFHMNNIIFSWNMP